MSCPVNVHTVLARISVFAIISQAFCVFSSAQPQQPANPLDNISYAQTSVPGPGTKQILEVRVALKEQLPSCPLSSIELGKLQVTRGDIVPAPNQIVDTDLVSIGDAGSAERHYRLLISE